LVNTLSAYRLVSTSLEPYKSTGDKTMQSLLHEDRLSPSQLARKEGVHTSTVWRWMLHGVRGCVLESINIGSKRFTTLEAFTRFVESTTAAAAGEKQSIRPQTNRQRAASIARAEQELDEAGI